MPLVQIALRTGKSSEYRKAISNNIHQAMVEEVSPNWRAYKTGGQEQNKRSSTSELVNWNKELD